MESWKNVTNTFSENEEPTAEFVETFVKKYQLELPKDIFFDSSKLFDWF